MGLTDGEGMDEVEDVGESSNRRWDKGEFNEEVEDDEEEDNVDEDPNDEGAPLRGRLC